MQLAPQSDPLASPSTTACTGIHDRPSRAAERLHGWKLVVAGCLFLAALSLWLRSAIPVYAISQATHDDQLYVRLAYQIGSGFWLGPYDQFILAKGVGYPLFVLMAFAAGIPLKLAEQGLYLAAAALATWLVARLTRSKLLALGLFACLALNPAVWSISLSRVIREGEYIGLSPAFLLMAAVVLLLPKPALSRPVRWIFLVGLGVIGGFYWLTRDEGMWLAPALAVLLIAAAIGVWQSRQSLPGGAVLKIFGAAAIPVIAFATVLGAVAGMNYRHYGAFITNEVQSAAFQAAYGALMRIRPREFEPYVPFPQDAQDKAYAVSETARALRPIMSRPDDPLWFKPFCEELHLDRCSGLPAAWFLWVMRDAAANAGHHTSARVALGFYEQLATEINGACEQGRLDCLAPRATLMPPFRWSYVGDTARAVPRLFHVLSAFAHGEIATRPPLGWQTWTYRFEDMVGPVSRPPVPTRFIIATVTTGAGTVDLAVHDRDGASYKTDLKVAPSGTFLVKEAQEPGRGPPIDFDVGTDCIRPSCELIIRWGQNERRVAIEKLVEHAVISDGDMKLEVKQVSSVGAPGEARGASEVRRGVQLRLMRAIGTVYAAAAPGLAAVALFGVIAAIALRRSIGVPRGIIPLVLACGAAVMARILLLAYIHATSFPTDNSLYLSPASLFLVMFIVLGCYLTGLVARAGGVFLASGRKRGTGSAPPPEPKRNFARVKHVEPGASRADSGEIYLRVREG